MKKLFVPIIILLWMVLFGVNTVSAHPLDISSTVLSLGGKNTIAGTTYLHSYEVGIMLGRLGYDVSEVGLYNNYHSDIIQYFDDKFTLRNNDIECPITHIQLPTKEGYEILSRGVEVQYILTCQDIPRDLHINLSFFLDFPLQTNRLSIVSVDGNELFYKVGTVQYPELRYEVGKTVIPQDGDNDGLSDEEELVYKTNPENPDTDGDYYYDGEEVNFGWLPLNPSPSPGQKPRSTYPDSIMLRPDSTISQERKDHSLSSIGPGGTVFENLLKRIGMTISKEEVTAFPIIFAITVFLGFLHAMGPGHAKGLLSGIMVHKNASFLSGMRFIVIFSITHIIDIFLLFLIIRFLFHFVDASILLAGIQQASAFVLLSLGIYLLYRAFRGKLDESDESEEYSKGRITLLAIIAGLAPCSFGWSLFFMLMSLGKIDWIPPLIFAIALGIFLCLFIILLVIHYTKKTSYSRFQSLSRYSVRFSAILIFVIGIYLTIYNFAL